MIQSAIQVRFIMADRIHMEVDRVMNFSTQFAEFSQTLRTISTALQTAITILDTTAFIGAVGGNVLKLYLEQFKPVVDRAAETCAEMSTDLRASAIAYQNGDVIGATKFH